MFFDEDYDDEKQEELAERSWLKVMGAALLLFLVFLIACAAATEQPFKEAYQECIERGGNTLTCSQE